MDMLCTKCKKEQATFFYTQNINGKETSAALCKSCAKQSGIDSSDILSPLFHPFAESKVQKRDSGKTCNLCGLTFSDILSLGKVGCPDCYNTFRQELRDTIRSIHGTAKHVGLTPERSTAITPEPQKEPSEEEMLRVALEAAIRDENYEEAARLRDRIKELKGEN